MYTCLYSSLVIETDNENRSQTTDFPNYLLTGWLSCTHKQHLKIADYVFGLANYHFSWLAGLSLQIVHPVGYACGLTKFGWQINCGWQHIESVTMMLNPLEQIHQVLRQWTMY